MRELERPVGEALQVHRRRIDRRGRDAHVAAEDVDAVERERDPVGGDERRSVAALDGESVDARIAAHFEPAFAGLAVDERDLEAGRQRAAGELDARLRRQIGDVVLERQRVEVDVQRGLGPLGQRRGRPAQFKRDPLNVAFSFGVTRMSVW